MNQRPPFSFYPEQLSNLFYSSKCMEEVLRLAEGPAWTCTPDANSADSFGSYAVGRRCFLRSKNSDRCLYIYAGSIYGYGKTAGYFVEVDAYSNPQFHDQLTSRLKSGSKYILDNEKEGFLKLFMPEKSYSAFGGYKTNRDILLEFVRDCFDGFVKALDEGD